MLKLLNLCSATFYTQNGNAGACGDKHADSDIICALETSTYAHGANCGKHVMITNTKTGKTVNVLVADVRVVESSLAYLWNVNVGE